MVRAECLQQQQSQQYSMSLYDSKLFFYPQSKRTTVFPTLRKIPDTRSIRPTQLLNFSMDEKKYRMTSNQMLKGIFKQNDSQISKLRSTFVKQSLKEQPKKKIGHYTVIKEIGKGGFAQVYEVVGQNGKRYALKEYSLQNSLECYHNESNIGDYFFDKGNTRPEFEKAEGSRHLIRFVEKFRIGKYGYIVQQLLQHNFSKIINDIQGIFHNNERIYEVKFKDFYRSLAHSNYLCKIMLELCSTVNLINHHGFVHCDLKLENLMVQFEGDVPTLKVIDYGSTFQRQYGLPKITITPEYMPPELLLMLENGSSDYQLLRRIDVWSVGCILLEIVTGVPLWFRYKCRVQIKGKPTVMMGFFSLTGRDYTKIMRKQKQLVEHLNRIPFTFKQFDKFRPILKKLLVLNPQKRARLEDIVKDLESMS